MITLVAGTRPNFVKVAPVLRALGARGAPTRVVHTGQHFDERMSVVFFRDLGFEPDHCLDAPCAEDALAGLRADFSAHRPEAVVVVGDVNSTLAGALAAAELEIPLVHVEAGLRSRDLSMPEEVNRIITDHVSALALVPSRDAADNLSAEGIDPEKIVFVGNVMIDSLHAALERTTDALERLGLRRGGYALATLHRPSNVDHPAALALALDALTAMSARTPLLLPLHPRTRQRAAAFGLDARLRDIPGLLPLEPLGYRDFVTLLASARLVATDSGGIQEEATVLGVPCLTLRERTERPITVTQGTNTVVGLDPARIIWELDAILAGRGKRGSVPEGWDGKAGERSADAVLALTRLGARRA